MEDAGQEWVLNRRLNGGSHDGTIVASAVYCRDGDDQSQTFATREMTEGQTGRGELGRGAGACPSSATPVHILP
jgi:hypothetical protein